MHTVWIALNWPFTTFSSLVKGSCLVQFGVQQFQFLEKNPPPLWPGFLLSSWTCQWRSSGIVFCLICQAHFGSWRRDRHSCQVARVWLEFIHKSHTDPLKPAPKHAQTVSVIGISLSSRWTWANLPLKDCIDVSAVLSANLVVNLWNKTCEGTYLHLLWANNPNKDSPLPFHSCLRPLCVCFCVCRDADQLRCSVFAFLSGGQAEWHLGMSVGGGGRSLSSLSSFQGPWSFFATG